MEINQEICVLQDMTCEPTTGTNSAITPKTLDDSKLPQHAHRLRPPPFNATTTTNNQIHRDVPDKLREERISPISN